MIAHTACSRDEPVPKFGPGHEDVGAGEVLVVEHEVPVVAPLGEEARAEAGALDPLEPVAGDDLVGVDVGAVERHRRAGDDDDGFHGGPPRWSDGRVAVTVAGRRGSAKVPAMAVAAATAGETRWVRPPRPWRPSKLRLLVEAARSPGASLSGFMARHIEQPGSRQSKPAAVKTSSSPSASAWSFTAERAGHDHGPHASAPPCGPRPRRPRPAGPRCGRWCTSR